MAYIITADVTLRCKLAVSAGDKTTAKQRAAANLRKLIVNDTVCSGDVTLLDEKKAQVCILKVDPYTVPPETQRQFDALREEPDSIEFFND